MKRSRPDKRSAPEIEGLASSSRQMLADRRRREGLDRAWIRSVRNGAARGRCLAKRKSEVASRLESFVRTLFNAAVDDVPHCSGDGGRQWRWISASTALSTSAADPPWNARVPVSSCTAARQTRRCQHGNRHRSRAPARATYSRSFPSSIQSRPRHGGVQI